MSLYSANALETRWQEVWARRKLYQTDFSDTTRKKYYSLTMFPYPSGDKLHIGHWYNFAPADSWARYLRMKGYNVFEPMGFDAFGLPAENYAIKTGVAPVTSTAANVKTMIHQLEEMGAMYDWSHTVNTSEPEYYKWTQWLFLQMYKRGLAYKKKAPVNWCPGCKTVLANEQVHEGICDRCKSEVTKKNLEQWFWKIKDYAEKLLDYTGLDWPEKTLLMQKHWIGKSNGAEVGWKVDGQDLVLDTFTTTVDTIYGVTFVVISPEHPALSGLVTPDQKLSVKQYVDAAKKMTDIERMSTDRKKTGVFTGMYMVHPFTGKKVPLWVADYVLMSYGTGVVMGVPAHDQRDMDFAKHYKLPIVESVQLDDGATFVYDDLDKYTVRGKIIDSGAFTGLSILDGRKKIVEALSKKKLGREKIEYKLRDWLISRQRYWGAPIPIINCKNCGEVPVPEKDLPVILPRIRDYKPKGKAPLATSTLFMNTKCPKCKRSALREPDTMDTFVCSSWYYLRYPSAHLKSKPFDKAVLKQWGPVDMYIGGPEHACMHLLYARFVNRVLFDADLVPFKEPFKRLVHQGMITKDGAKMSKSRGNVVSPDGFVKKYGSDVFRMYLMFMGPFTQGGDWNDKGITGISRFVQKFWKMIGTPSVKKNSDEVTSIMHRTIKKVTEDIEKLHYNTAIAALMELLNEVSAEGLDDSNKKIAVRLVAPMAPHLAEELWSRLNELEPAAKEWTSVFDAKWPSHDPKRLASRHIQLVVQVNGKMRASMSVATDLSQAEAVAAAKSHENVQRFLEGTTLLKEIYVPNKLVNFVVR